MKKTKISKFAIILVLIVVSISAIVFVGCGEKDGYEGDYECYYYALDGSSRIVSSVYEYYTITLDGRGGLTAKFKLSVSPYTSRTDKSKYEIDGTKLIEKVGNLTNEYEISDGVITLEATVQGVNIVAKFKITEV